jgi:hypothetical protein
MAGGVPEPHKITQPLILLCEGGADNEFFKRLVRSRKLSPFCFPFPPDKSEGPPLYGRDGFRNMLSVLNSYFNLDPELNKRTKGILIALDSANDHRESFSAAREQIIEATTFGVPQAAGEVASSNDRPPIAVITVPGNEPGSLESLCVKAMRDAFPDHAKCMDAFFECCPSDYDTWNSEGRDKARLRCLIASTYRPDPSRSTRLIFAGRNGEAPAIDIENALFDPIAAEVEKFCTQVGT